MFIIFKINKNEVVDDLKKNFNGKKYYKISLEEKEYVKTDYYTYLILDFNNNSLIQLLMEGITYITAQNIIDLREQVKITKDKINELLESNIINDVYFLRLYKR